MPSRLLTIALAALVAVAATASGAGAKPQARTLTLYSFNLYSNPSLKKRAGSAIFTCQYNFDRNAFCDVSFTLRGGDALIASGAFNFAATRFSLAVTGGYGKYVATVGSVLGTPSAHHAQKLSFTFR